jgi:hypothetical protein
VGVVQLPLNEELGQIDFSVGDWEIPWERRQKEEYGLYLLQRVGLEGSSV